MSVELRVRRRWSEPWSADTWRSQLVDVACSWFDLGAAAAALPPSLSLSALSRASSATTSAITPRIAASDCRRPSRTATRSARGRSSPPARRIERVDDRRSRGDRVPPGRTTRRVGSVGGSPGGGLYGRRRRLLHAGVSLAKWWTTPAGTRSCSKRSMSSACSRVSAMSSRPFSRRSRISGLISNATSRPSNATTWRSRSTVASLRLHQRPHLLLGQRDRQQADLGAVAVEDVGEARRDDRLEAEVLRAPTPRARARTRSRSCARSTRIGRAGLQLQPSLRQS